jgi:23S rRNA U2552 (ribose-2'-O)-methylase RlmE/FtsJ
VQGSWGRAKKISNDYEYIYTSTNYKKNISSVTPVSRSFFKLREIIYDFHLDISGSSSCVAEAPGGFIQSILSHSDDNNVHITKIYGITLISDSKDIPYWNSSIINNTSVHVSNGHDGTGNLYKLPNILSFIKTCGKSDCQLVTADGGFDYTTDFEQELSSYKLFYSEIMIAINIQKKGGNFICKLFDLFYISTLQLVFLLYISYETISFIKPLTSRQSNSEKYIVCRGFNGYNKNISNIMCMNFGKEGLPIHLPDDFIELVNEYHTSFTANQIKKIDSTLNIISKKNHTDKPTNKQVELAKEWCSKYDVTINKHCYYL